MLRALPSVPSRAHSHLFIAANTLMATAVALLQVRNSVAGALETQEWAQNCRHQGAQSVFHRRMPQRVCARRFSQGGGHAQGDQVIKIFFSSVSSVETLPQTNALTCASTIRPVCAHSYSHRRTWPSRPLLAHSVPLSDAHISTPAVIVTCSSFMDLE